MPGSRRLLSHPYSRPGGRAPAGAARLFRGRGQYRVRLAAREHRGCVVVDEGELGAAASQLHRAVAVAHERAGGAHRYLVEVDPRAGDQDPRLTFGEAHDEALAVVLAREGVARELFLALLLRVLAGGENDGERD